ncbi:MAG: hypothetical protein JWO94_2757 [Verrucomicrobiaceae bacterium]|nr:hypothetical protein [Verrucomicrobiaceae bacterium]
MAVKIAPSLRSALERLKHAGSVNGICLAWRRQVVVNLLPYEDFRAENLVHAVHDAHEHFAGGGREVKTFWFGFEGVHVLALRRGECSLIILHSRAVEADFMANAAEVLLDDCQLLIDAALNPSGSNMETGETQRLEELPG